MGEGPSGDGDPDPEDVVAPILDLGHVEPHPDVEARGTVALSRASRPRASEGPRVAA
jgi:hypothetical protein